MEILLIEDRLEEKEKLLPLLKEKFVNEIHTVSSMEEGIELVEKANSEIKIIVCDYHGSSLALVQCLVSIVPEATFLIFADSSNSLQSLLKKQPRTYIEIIERSKIRTELPKALEKLEQRGALKLLRIVDSEFIRMNLTSYRLLKPLESDVYIRLGENKYVKVYRKDDNYDEKDLAKYVSKVQGEYFYIKNTDARIVMARHSERTAALLKAKTPQVEQARATVSTNLEFLHDVVLKIGVTPEVQQLTKKTVGLTVKLLGSNPKLSTILKRMKQDQGQYVSSHSLALAEIACALACKVDWHSSGTFLKLSIASFLHDLPITDNNLAQIQDLSEFENRKEFTMMQIQNYKLHPVQAADFSRQFREVPPDVDTIVMEHHERPDGSGFPRGLFHHQISPLSCLFIIAHDILNYFLKGQKGASMQDFLSTRREKYTQGTFKSIFKSLQADFSARR